MTDQKMPGQTVPGQKIPEQVIPGLQSPGETTDTALPAPDLAPDLSAGPAEPTETTTRRRHLLRRTGPRRQSGFRRWRKTRPFWGGLLTMLAGLEIAAITGTTYELILISRSVTFAITVGAVIWVFGFTMWLSPPLSQLLGLLTLLAALVSFVTSNLGGFLLGMLLAILGGGLAFAWEPGRETLPDEDASVADDRGVAIPQQRAPEHLSVFDPVED
jgi:hypothetical protein